MWSGTSIWDISCCCHPFTGVSYWSPGPRIVAEAAPVGGLAQYCGPVESVNNPGNVLVKPNCCYLLDTARLQVHTRPRCCCCAL